MAGFRAEADAPVGLAAEVTAVDAVAGEVDRPTATRTLTTQAREFETVAAHVVTIGAAEPCGLISLDQRRGGRVAVRRAATDRGDLSPLWTRFHRGVSDGLRRMSNETL